MKAAIVQAAPVPLDITTGIKELEQHVRHAIDEGAKLVAFGETFLGGYPLWLDEASDAGKWDHPGTKALHALMLDQAVRENDPRLEGLQEIVDKSDVMVSFGTHERRRNSLYNNQMLFRPKQSPLPHRKLVPTHGERLIWNRGDGSTLDVHASEAGNIGSLICWEHWMPLARAAMHNAPEAIHIAAWPTVRETYSIASRHYAFEGRCFVLAAGTVQNRDDVVESIERLGGPPQTVELALQMGEGQLQFGGSQIIAPDASILAQAGDGEEIITAELDMSQIGEALAALDTDGHYSRADVFELHVDRRAKDGVIWND